MMLPPTIAPGVDLLTPSQEPVTGSRSFQCPDCGFQWTTDTRDYRSSSVETCEECGADVSTYKTSEKPDFLTDASENIT